MAYSIRNKVDLVKGAAYSTQHILKNHLVDDNELLTRLTKGFKNATTFTNTSLSELYQLTEDAIINEWDYIKSWLLDTKDWDDYMIYQNIQVKGYGYFKNKEKYTCDEMVVVLKKDRYSAGDAFIIASCYPINQKYLDRE